MELLIIFIIIMVLSSIMRSYKSAAREDKPAAPTNEPAGLFQEKEQGRETDTVYSHDEGEKPFAWLERPHEKEQYRPEAGDILSDATSEQDVASYYREEEKEYVKAASRNKKSKRAEQGSLSSKKATQKNDEPQKSRSQNQRRFQEASPGTKGSYLQEEGIEIFLTGRRLPLGIAFSEVLSAPRSKKPYSSLRRY